MILRRTICADRHPRGSGDPVSTDERGPRAEAGEGRTIISGIGYWVPTFAGMTVCGGGERSACAGMTDRRGGAAAIHAFVLTIIGNLVFVLSVSSYWQPIVSGVILLIAVLASSLAEKSARRSLA